MTPTVGCRCGCGAGYKSSPRDGAEQPAPSLWSRAALAHIFPLPATAMTAVWLASAGLDPTLAGCRPVSGSALVGVAVAVFGAWPLVGCALLLVSHVALGPAMRGGRSPTAGDHGDADSPAAAAGDDGAVSPRAWSSGEAGGTWWSSLWWLVVAGGDVAHVVVSSALLVWYSTRCTPEGVLAGLALQVATTLTHALWWLSRYARRQQAKHRIEAESRGWRLAGDGADGRQHLLSAGAGTGAADDLTAVMQGGPEGGGLAVGPAPPPGAVVARR
jgi:hypothetical protein